MWDPEMAWPGSQRHELLERGGGSDLGRKALLLPKPFCYAGPGAGPTQDSVQLVDKEGFRLPTQ